MPRPDPGRPSPPTHLGWDLATTATALVAVGLQVLFFALDVRVPTDPGRYLVQIPTYYWGIREGHLLSTLATALGEPAGWYQLAEAALLASVGRTPLVPEAVMVATFAAVLAGVALLARRLGGSAAALAAVALTAAMPMVSSVVRTSWIHVPEAALLLLLAASLARDPALHRWRTVFVVGLLGGLAVQLRLSALPWLALAGVAVAAPALQARRWGRVAAVGAAWLLAALPVLGRLEGYGAYKQLARARYALVVPPLWVQALELLTLPVLVVAGVGLASLGLLAWTRRGTRSPGGFVPPLPVLALLAGWVMGPLVTWAVFRAGIDNFTVLGPALAVLAAVGLARRHQALALLPLVPFLLTTAQQAGPFPVAEAVAHVSPGVSIFRDIQNTGRPYPLFGGPQVTALLDATCPSDAWRSCHVVVDQGLFRPASEDPGQLELFLLGEDRVELRTVSDELAHDTASWEAWRVDALLLFDCGPLDRGWVIGSPHAAELAVDVLLRGQLQLAWADRVGLACQARFFAAHLAAPGLLPRPSVSGNLLPWSAETWLAERRAMLPRNPRATARPEPISAYGRDQGWTDAPPSWTPEAGAVERAAARRWLDPASPWLVGVISGQPYPFLGR